MRKAGSNAVLGGGGFHHVAISAFDFDASLRFYEEGLGFKRAYGWGADGRPEGERDTRAAMLDTGDGNYLEVFAGGSRKIEQDHANESILHFALRTLDCDAAYACALAAGGIVITPPKTVSINGDSPEEFRIAFLRGLDGEVIEFFQNDNL